MVEVVDADIWELPAHTLVNPVNCVGVMGKGLARQFAVRFPEHLAWYEQACRDGVIRPGHPALWRPDGGGQWVLAAPTKRHWRQPSMLGDVDALLDRMRRRLPGSGVESIAMPALGCGLGGLDFAEVLPLVEASLADHPHQVWVIRPR